MAVAVSSLANGGYKVQPHLVQAIKNSDGTLEYTRPVMEKIEWIRPEYLGPVKKGMKRVVTEGSGRYYTNLSSLGIEVAGKTGTAQNHMAVITAGFSPIHLERN